MPTNLKTLRLSTSLVTVAERTGFVIEKKEGAKIGFIIHFSSIPRLVEIAYAMIPSIAQRSDPQASF